MIYSFGARNFFSFREGMRVSFELNSKVPKSVSKGNRVSTVLGIKGANASGKTNILKALAFIRSFAADSFGNDESQQIEIEPFFRNTKGSDFYIDFETLGTRYIYELTVTREHVLREAIYKKVNRKTPLIIREYNKITYRIQELSELDLIQLKSNASIISTALKYKFKSKFEDIHNIAIFLRTIRGNVSEIGAYHADDLYPIDSVSKFYYENPEAFAFAKKIIIKSDLGISDVKIIERILEDGNKNYFPVFFHHAEGVTDDIPSDELWLTSWDESSGTTALYRRLGTYWVVLQLGGILVMDEFDIHCHNMLLPQLIELFESEETNPHNAQFIFTAHSTEIMDILGKYRTILVNKESLESYCYRLDEIPGDLVRNDRSLATLYREGKIGGIPKL